MPPKIGGCCNGMESVTGQVGRGGRTDLGKLEPVVDTDVGRVQTERGASCGVQQIGEGSPKTVSL